MQASRHVRDIGHATEHAEQKGRGPRQEISDKFHPQCLTANEIGHRLANLFSVRNQSLPAGPVSGQGVSKQTVRCQRCRIAVRMAASGWKAEIEFIHLTWHPNSPYLARAALARASLQPFWHHRRTHASSTLHPSIVGGRQRAQSLGAATTTCPEGQSH